MKKIIDLIRFRLGMFIAFGFGNKTISATAQMLSEEAKNIRCEHCGKPVIKYL